MRIDPRHLLLLLFALGALGATPGCGERAPRTLVLEGEVMGTTWHAQIVETQAPADAATLRRGIVAAFDAVDAAMSTWKPASELSRFNAARSTDWVPVSAPTAEVVALAREVSARSGGAFDVTVGPLVDLWGFGAAPRTALPSEEELAAARADVGWRLLEVRASPPALRKQRPGVAADLSGIAKGHALDRAMAFLHEAGCRHALVELGGEVRASGRRADGTGWRVGIERPSPDGGAVEAVARLEDRALATSGDYRRYVVEDGRRLSHILDPRTGRPKRHALASVTVVAPRAAEADAWATALLVLGPDEALALARREGLAALLLVWEGERLVARATPGFPEGRPGASRTESEPPRQADLGALVLVTFVIMVLAGAALAARRAGGCGQDCRTCTAERPACHRRRSTP